MADQWMIRGPVYANCNCDYSCPCQFQAPSTHGFCQAVIGGSLEEGRFNDVRLDGLKWVTLITWPGEIAEGNGKQQIIVDESATPDQREALLKILRGESTAPGSTISIAIENGMEYQTANIGRGTSKAKAGIEIELADSYGQFCVYHMNQDGLIRN